MPSQQSKPSNNQKTLFAQKFEVLTRQSLLQSKKNDHGFDLQQAKHSLKDSFAETEQMKVYPVDHLPEDITEDFLIISFFGSQTKSMAQPRNSNNC